MDCDVANTNDTAQQKLIQHGYLIPRYGRVQAAEKIAPPDVRASNPQRASQRFQRAFEHDLS
jgi:hypothetical protein